MNIYVGNLPRTATEETIRELFEKHGAVDSVRIMLDRFTNEPRGFAFVTMESDDDANKAITALNEYTLEGRALRISEARPPEERRSTGGAGGSRGGFGGNRGPRREGGSGGFGGDRGGFGGGRNRY